jgi:C-terminal processing protease CtpA/Prc
MSISIVGERIAKTIVEKAKAGAYDRYKAAELLAEALNDELHAVSHDRHLNVMFYSVPPIEPGPAPDPQQIQTGLAKHNCGFVRAEHLAPNIGYVKLNSFALPDKCGETASAAMRFVADSDAVIFDLRDNGGGVPAMVSYLESFLFDKSTHLNDVYYRKTDETHQFWTLPFLPGKRIPHAPIYVLTSKNTFSAAEEFAYTLQALKRATVVGETTGGGAHPYDVVKIDSNFTVEVPFARSINPVTKKDWEGTGVVPDVAVSASEALDRAIQFAKESIKSK